VIAHLHLRSFPSKFPEPQQTINASAPAFCYLKISITTLTSILDDSRDGANVDVTAQSHIFKAYFATQIILEGEK
jgi:hypothetical protein